MRCARVELLIFTHTAMNARKLPAFLASLLPAAHAADVTKCIVKFLGPVCTFADATCCPCPLKTCRTCKDLVCCTHLHNVCEKAERERIECKGCVFGDGKDAPGPCEHPRCVRETCPCPRCCAPCVMEDCESPSYCRLHDYFNKSCRKCKRNMCVTHSSLPHYTGRPPYKARYIEFCADCMPEHAPVACLCTGPPRSCACDSWPCDVCDVAVCAECVAGHECPAPSKRLRTHV